MPRKQRGADADDSGPNLISLEEQQAAVRLLDQAFEAGELDGPELGRRLGRVHRAVTPRDLWKASGHRAGSRRRSDWGDLKRAIRLQVAILCFAVLAMLLVLYGTVLYYQGDRAASTIWPWEWGKHSAPQFTRSAPVNGVVAGTATLQGLLARGRGRR